MTCRRDNGFALVTALWAALILALVVSFVVKAGRTDAHIAHTALHQAEMRAVARGAIAMTELRLLAPIDTQMLLLDGTSFQIICAGRPVQMRVQDQAGLLDLNFASGDVLHRLADAAGLDGMAAQTLADRIMDWREKGAGRRLNGAKAADYAEAGFAYGPREGPFESVAELRLVMGMTSSLFDRLEPALTVYSQKPVIEPQSAPELVLVALPGMTADSAAAMMRERQLQRKRRGDTPAQLTEMSGRSLRIAAEIVEKATTASASTVVRVTGHSTLPFWTYQTGE